MLKKILMNQKGVSMLAALTTVLILGSVGAATVVMTTGTNTTSVNEMMVNQSLYVGQAGLEKMRYDVGQGLDPTVSDQPFGPGTFSITTDTTSGIGTVVSQVGAAKKTQTIGVTFANNCVTFDTSSVSILHDTASANNNKELLDVKLVKNCVNSKSILDKMWIEWNWDNCVLNQVYSESNTLESCPVDHGGAQVKQIYIDSTHIYNPGLGIGTPGNGGADPGVEIDVENYTLSANTSYALSPIRFDKDIPEGALFTMTAEFTDTSQISATFQIENDPGFTIDNGAVETEAHKNVEIKVLCSEITYGEGGPEIPVTVKVKKDNASWQNLFNGQDVDGGEIDTSESGSGTSYTIQAKGKYGSWQRTYDSTNLNQVKTLANNDQAPPLEGFGGQKPVSDCIADYLDSSGKVVLPGNAAIQLWELGVDMAYSPSSPAADFQDLVILFTITE